MILYYISFNYFILNPDKESARQRLKKKEKKIKNQPVTTVVHKISRKQSPQTAFTANKRLIWNFVCYMLILLPLLHLTSKRGIFFLLHTM